MGNGGALSLNWAGNGLPLVSIIIPTLNEAKSIGNALASIEKNDYPKDRLELIVVDGGSSDATLEIVQTFNSRLLCKIFSEKGCSVYSALNLGLKQAQGDVILRVDARSEIPDVYISTCVAHLINKPISAVGGVQDQYGVCEKGRAIAAATTHTVGVGGAAFRTGKRSGFVDTVYLGCYPKSVFSLIGGYDEDGVVVSEDSMLNKKIRDLDGKILLDHSLRVKYPAKNSFKSLAKQYFIYGGARAHVFLKYKTLTSFRQVLPVGFVSVICILLLLSFFSLHFLVMLLVLLTIYMAVILFVSFRAADGGRQPITVSHLVKSFMVIHFSWPVGFLLRALVPPAYFKILGSKA